MEDIKIIYKDKHIIAVVKAPGMLSEFDESGKPSVPLAVAKKLAANGEKSDIFTVHRLDQGVGGIMILARTKIASSKLIADIAAKKVKKEYLAVVHGRPAESSGEYFDLLFRDSAKNKTYVVDRMRKGVRDASLSYKVLGSADSEAGELTLVGVELHTGRTHQIRVQFSSRKMPLWGDYKYGGKDNGNIALFSHRIMLDHPVTGKKLEFSANPDSVYPWSEFSYDSEIN